MQKTIPLHMTDNARAAALIALETVKVAQELLGWSIVSMVDGIRCSGIIVEAEAYCQHGDDASHSRSGETERNRSMFLNAGHWYVYRSYGVHWCLNLVAARAGTGEAVLIRSIVPAEGVASMMIRRNLVRKSIRDLSNGPGKVCQALSITKQFDGACAFYHPGCQLWIEPPLPGPRIIRSNLSST